MLTKTTDSEVYAKTMSEEMDAKVGESRSHFAASGERANRGSPIRQSLRPRRALMMLGCACMALFTSSVEGSHRALLADSSEQVPKDPKSRAEALSMDRPGWTASMDLEMEAHRVNKSWEWIRADEVPSDRRLIKLIWVFKVKRNGKLKSHLGSSNGASLPSLAAHTLPSHSPAHPICTY